MKNILLKENIKKYNDTVHNDIQFKVFLQEPDEKFDKEKLLIYLSIFEESQFYENKFKEDFYDKFGKQFNFILINDEEREFYSVYFFYYLSQKFIDNKLLSSLQKNKPLIKKLT